jgi:hypothetical protein
MNISRPGLVPVLDPSIIDAMIASGCTVEQLGAVVKAHLLAENEKQLERRHKAAIIKRNQRLRSVHRTTQDSEIIQQNQQSCPQDSSGQIGSSLTYVEPMYVKPMYVEHMLDIGKKERKKESNTIRAREEELVANDFQVFYQEYPHKVGKPAAAKAFASAIKKTSLEKIISGLRSYIDTKPPDRAWCNPATWLNHERWNDQPAIIQPPTQQISPRLQVIFDTRRKFHEVAEAARAAQERDIDNCFETPQLRSLG